MSMTKQQIASAKTMWANGLSASKIASEIGASRSAVCGYASRHRQDFPARGPTGGGPRGGTQAASKSLFGSSVMERRAIAMWRAGRTASQIADGLPASLATVKSNLRRHPDRFPPREEPPARKDAAAKQPRQRVTSSPEEAEKPVVVETPPPESDTAGVTILELSDRGCRFLLTDPALGLDARYCGEKAVPGKSWCRHHMGAVFGMGEE